MSDVILDMVPCPVCGGDLEEDDGLISCQDCDFEDALYDGDDDEDEDQDED